MCTLGAKLRTNSKENAFEGNGIEVGFDTRTNLFTNFQQSQGIIHLPYIYDMVGWMWGVEGYAGI